MPLVGNKIDISTDNFGQMVRDRRLLVDKTLMIKDFWEGQTVSLMTRPRRFGKSLTLSMLQHFFASHVAGESTQGLFNDFIIAQAKTETGINFIEAHQGKYPVICVSFKDIKESSFPEAINKIKNLIMDLFFEYQHLLPTAVDDSDPVNIRFRKYCAGSNNIQDLEDALKFLSSFLYKSYSNKKVIILVDEYDAPLTSAYEHKYLDDLSDFLRNMFSAALKTNPYLEKGLMTGILRVSKNSMLSGLNNLKIYTLLDKDYSSYFGFTESEIKELVTATGVTQSLDEIRLYYNGYKIVDTVIYNPWSAMNFFLEKALKPNWVLTSNDGLIKHLLLKADNRTKEDFTDLICRKTIRKVIDVSLRYDELMEKNDALWTLLFFCGYLTAEAQELVEGEYVCQLRIPNEEIAIQYKKVFSGWLMERIEQREYHSFLNSLVEGRVEEFTKSLTGYLFSCTSSHDFQAESDYHCFVLGLLASMTGTHIICSNKEYGTGRPDCLLIPKDLTKTQGIILEFKHIHFKKGEMHKDLDHLQTVSHASAQEGLEQINMRGYDYAFEQHAHITSVLKIGIAFSNRIVSSAYILGAVIRSKEAGASSQPIVFYDADESAYQKIDAEEKY